MNAVRTKALECKRSRGPRPAAGTRLDSRDPAAHRAAAGQHHLMHPAEKIDTTAHAHLAFSVSMPAARPASQRRSRSASTVQPCCAEYSRTSASTAAHSRDGPEHAAAQARHTSGRVRCLSWMEWE